MEDYSNIIQTLLKKLGIANKKDADAFINPSYNDDLHDPFLMRGMDKAVERIRAAIKSDEKIAIYSDFDADGIPAGVLLYDFFKKIGYNNFTNYIPHRDTEGYGFHKGAVDKLANEEVGLIITVDVGITAADTVEHASLLGVDVIITDHHEPLVDLPKALAILNPKQVNCKYPFDGLCGTGVAYKLVQALIAKGEFNGVKEGWEKWLLDLVAIATVADMVPLVGENRALTHWGLIVLRKSRRIGIIALCRKLRINQGLINENDIGFSIGPRINASSRMGHPEDAFSLLSTDSIEEAEALASKLESLNNKRKGSVAAIVKQAKAKVEQMSEGGELPNVIVTGDPSWSPALVGLASGSLSDSLGKVVCLWGREGTGTLKGSCRSGDGTSVVDIFNASKDALLYYGGHHAAGGFAVSDDGIHSLSDAFNKSYSKVQLNDKPQDILVEDLEFELKDINSNNLKDINTMAPFGIGNPKPVISFTSLTVSSIRHFGKEQNHVEVYFKDAVGCTRKASKFFATSNSFTNKIIEGSVVKLLANMEESAFAGRRTLELRIIDIV